MSATKAPTPKEYFEKVALYGVTPFDATNVRDIIGILFYSGPYDAYCTDCAKEATFKTAPVSQQASMQEVILRLGAMANVQADPLIPLGAYLLKGECTRDSSHTQAHAIVVRRKALGKSPTPFYSYSLIKIGQYPSAADLELPKLKKYQKVLTLEQREEFARALGLAAHGVGVGSYVYLRRIFESLIEQAHTEAKKDKGWKESKYPKARMAEKVKMLRKHLPQFIVENPSFYSLISKGVHELTEQECLEHFSVIRACIEIMLDAKLAAKELAEKMSIAQSGLSTAIGKVSAKEA